MKNCLIMGSGRSGTSMLAGLLSKSGYYMGKDSYGKDEFAKHGGFEWLYINKINERIIIDTINYNKIKQKFPKNANWLSRLPLNSKLIVSKEIKQKIKKLTKRQPLCFKDPRFSYTSPVWNPYIKNCVNLVIFRHPSRTAQSLMNMAKKRYNLNLPYNTALQIWLHNYKHIFKNKKKGKWFFIHFDQLFEKKVLERLNKITGASINEAFPDKTLGKKYKIKSAPKCEKIYAQLCKLAGY